MPRPSSPINLDATSPDNLNKKKPTAVIATESFLPALLLIALHRPHSHEFWTNFFFLTRQNPRSPPWTRFLAQTSLPVFNGPEMAIGWLENVAGIIEGDFDFENPDWAKKEHWGALFWSLIVSAAFMADPSRTEVFRAWVATLPMVLLCNDCKRDFLSLLKTHPIRKYTSSPEKHEPVIWSLMVRKAVLARVDRGSFGRTSRRTIKRYAIPAKLPQDEETLELLKQFGLVMTVPLEQLHPRGKQEKQAMWAAKQAEPERALKAPKRRKRVRASRPQAARPQVNTRPQAPEAISEPQEPAAPPSPPEPQEPAAPPSPSEPQEPREPPSPVLRHPKRLAGLFARMGLANTDMAPINASVGQTNANMAPTNANMGPTNARMGPQNARAIPMTPLIPEPQVTTINTSTLPTHTDPESGLITILLPKKKKSTESAPTEPSAPSTPTPTPPAPQPLQPTAKAPAARARPRQRMPVHPAQLAMRTQFLARQRALYGQIQPRARSSGAARPKAPRRPQPARRKKAPASSSCSRGRQNGARRAPAQTHRSMAQKAAKARAAQLARFRGIAPRPQPKRKRAPGAAHEGYFKPKSGCGCG